MIASRGFAATNGRARGRRSACSSSESTAAVVPSSPNARRSTVDVTCSSRAVPGVARTRWWSLVLDERLKVDTIRNGSCGDPIETRDVPRIVRALEDLGLLAERTMIAVDDGPSVFPGKAKRNRA